MATGGAAPATAPATPQQGGGFAGSGKVSLRVGHRAYDAQVQEETLRGSSGLRRLAGRGMTTGTRGA